MHIYIYIELSQARQGAFDIYKRDIGDTSLIEKHKTALRTKYACSYNGRLSCNTTGTVKPKLWENKLIPVD